MSQLTQNLSSFLSIGSKVMNAFDSKHWDLPSLDGLDTKPVDTKVKDNGYPVDPNMLVDVLTSYGVKATVEDIKIGPSVVTYMIELPVGAKSSVLVNRAGDLGRDLCSVVRVLPSIPGTRYLGIEVENNHKEVVYFKDMLERLPEGDLNVVLGSDAYGNPLHISLEAMPHLLVAGTTGSGKSVFLNSVICSLVARKTPKEVELLLVDPKRVEFSMYKDLPHLAKPIANDITEADEVLGYLVDEMERRMGVLQEAGVKNIKTYNKISKEKMPYQVCILDEFSDLMMTDKKLAKKFEDQVVRIAQLARAAGIHLIIATQKPLATVITSLIKGNMPSRISFRVPQSTDSEVIFGKGNTGAEKLLGKGDMIISTSDKDMVRAQGAWISDDDIISLVK